METVLSIIFGTIGVLIVVATIGVAVYKWKYNTKADLKPRKEKEF